MAEGVLPGGCVRKVDRDGLVVVDFGERRPENMETQIGETKAEFHVVECLSQSFIESTDLIKSTMRRCSESCGRLTRNPFRLVPVILANMPDPDTALSAPTRA